MQSRSGNICQVVLIAAGGIKLFTFFKADADSVYLLRLNTLADLGLMFVVFFLAIILIDKES
jgi:hypothetical protein